MVAPFTSPAMVRSLTSWIWLVEFRARSSALDASDERNGDLAASLQRHFPEVHIRRSDEATLADVRASNEIEGWNPASQTLGSTMDAPWPPASFDCIVIRDSIVRRNPGSAELVNELTHLHRLLRPGGWLAMSALNSGPNREGTISRHRFARLLDRVGFQEVRGYFLEHTLERPLFLIPDSAIAIRAYEAYDAIRGQTSKSRQLAARVGMRSALYPAYQLLARA